MPTENETLTRQAPISQNDATTACEVMVCLPITKHRIADMLCSALEGGSNYWYQIEESEAPPIENLRAHMSFGATKSNGLADVYRHIDYPLSEGGALLISDARATDEPRTERLDLRSIVKGLEIMSKKYPRHFGNFLAQKDDAETGDVFLQCCLFGETVYG